MVKRIFEKHPQDRFIEFLKTMLRSMSPHSYHDLTHKTLASGMKYLGNVLIVSAVILAVIVGFNLASFNQALNTELRKLNSLDVMFDLTEPIVIEKHKINITNRGNYTDENLLITDKNLIRKPTICILLKPTCIFAKDPVMTDYSDFQQHRKDFGKIVFFILLVMIPGLMMLYILYMLIKVLIILFVISYAAKFIADIFKFRIVFKKIILAAIFSSTIFLLLEPFNLVVVNLYYIHIGLFVILFSLSVLLVGERKHRYHNV